MRVLHILWQGKIGGAERAVYQLVQQQSRLSDMHVSVAFGQVKGLYATRITQAGVNVVDLALKSSSHWQSLPGLLHKLSGYDLHHFHVAEPLIMFSSVLTNHVKRLYTYRAGEHNRQGKRALRYWLTQWLIKTGFHAISANTIHGARVAEALFGLSQNSVAVTYNGINFAFLTPQRTRQQARQALGIPDESVFVIGTVSNLKDWKRTDWLLKAAVLLGFPHWQVVIIGDGPMRSNLEHLTSELGIQDKVLFLGQQAVVTDWLVGLDAFVLPSSSGESFGNAAVESLATGIPTVICKDGGGLLEHVVHQKTGWVAEGIEGIARCLTMIQENPSLALQVKEAGRAYVRQTYTIDNMVAAYHQFYASVGLKVD